MQLNFDPNLIKKAYRFFSERAGEYKDSIFITPDGCVHRTYNDAKQHCMGNELDTSLISETVYVNINP